ncbi:MAG: CoA-binding protein [Anaerolineae bacterium]|nr:CoA-binding protein [Anaerolineae bacterium]
MASLIDDLINRRVWAVVGVSADPAKFGYRIFRSLREAGYRVYGVNPNAREIDGQTIYPSLAALPERPEVVDIVVPPPVTERIVRECAELGLCRVWMQPGAESDSAIRFCQEHGIAVVYGACAMVEKRRWPSASDDGEEEHGDPGPSAGPGSRV